MAESKINLKNIRQAAAVHGIFSIAALARKARCSRNCIYELAAGHNRKRSSKARRRIKELINV